MDCVVMDGSRIDSQRWPAGEFVFKPRKSLVLCSKLESCIFSVQAIVNLSLNP